MRMLLAGCFFTLVSAVQAGTLPGRWEKVDILTKGSEVVITLISSESLECMFLGTSPESVFISFGNGERIVDKESIEKVYRLVEDSSWNGAVIGAGVGFAAGSLLLLTAKSSGGDWATSDAFELFGPIGAGAGAGIGFALDKRTRRKDVLYQRMGNVPGECEQPPR